MVWGPLAESWIMTIAEGSGIVSVFPESISKETTLYPVPCERPYTAGVLMVVFFVPASNHCGGARPPTMVSRYCWSYATSTELFGAGP